MLKIFESNEIEQKATVSKMATAQQEVNRAYTIFIMA
jgi:hypothetical protein